jgi:hypothetical protein
MNYTVFSLGMFSTELDGAFWTSKKQHGILPYIIMRVKVSQNSVVRLFLGITVYFLKKGQNRSTGLLG